MITLETRPGQAENEWAGAGLSKGGLTRFLKEAQRAVGLAGEVDVLLAGDRRLRRLNREFRGKDKATDVLSFPAAGDLAGGHAGDLAGEHAGDLAGGHAGDVAISLETAARQAREHGHSLRDEVRVLLLHGLLHLSGMDHESDRGEMAAREAELRAKLRLPVGLIARVEGGATGGGLNGVRSKAKRGFRSGMTNTRAKAGAKATVKARAKAERGFPSGMRTRTTTAEAKRGRA